MTTEQLPGLQLAVKLLAQIGDNDSDAAIAAVHAVMDPGQPGELPDGLQLAATLLDGDRDAFICGQAHPVDGLAPSDEEIAAGYLTAIAAIRTEHAQRLTLQHHAADQAQRIAELEVKCVTLKELRDAATDERDALRVKVYDLERAAVKRREISDEVEAELLDECDTLRTLEIRAASERDELRAKLAEQQAKAAGQEVPIGLLSELVEIQRLLLVDVEDICGRDGHGGQFEDGESEIIDRVRAHLATMASPEPLPVPAPDVEDLSDRLVAISEAVANSDDRMAQELLRDTLKLLSAAPNGAGKDENITAMTERVIKERDELRARLAEIEAQEPVAKIHTDGYWTARRGYDPLSDGKSFLSVYARPVPAQAVPTGERQAVLLTDEQRAWAHLGPLIEKHQIAISTPSSNVHRNGGPNAGWGNSGFWGGTAWMHGLERRPIAHGKSSALEAITELVAMIAASGSPE